MGGGASVVLVTGLVLLCMCLRRKRKRGKQSQLKETDQSREPVESEDRKTLPGVVRRAPVTNFQNNAYLHPASDGGTDGYLQPVKGQVYNKQSSGGVQQKQNYIIAA